MNRTLLKILGSFAVLGAAASVAGLGTFASFTSSTSASQAITSGTVSITLGAAGAQTNRLNIPVSNVVPGDTIQRSVDLINNGTITSDTLSSIQLTTSATITSLLDTDVRRTMALTGHRRMSELGPELIRWRGVVDLGGVGQRPAV